VVGAYLEDSCATGLNGNQTDNGCSDRGAVYVFTRSTNVWTQEVYAKAIPAIGSVGSFGSHLAFDGTRLAVSAGDHNCARGFNPSPGLNDCPNSGAVYLFSRTATSWAQRAYVKASNTGSFDFFEVPAISGNTLAVGAPAEDSCATGINGNQDDNSCNGSPPDSESGLAHVFGVGAVYVYVSE